MKTFRRILTGAALTAMVAGLASADTVIGYTFTTGATTTDITNLTVTLPSWNPGGSTAEDSVLSNVSHAGSGYTAGISMHSLNAANTTYTLIGYDITVSEFIAGNYSISNTSTNSTATGSAFVDTYNAVALNSPLTPPLGNTVDPTNDLFNYNETAIGTNPPVGPAGQAGEQQLSTGGGPDPSGGSITNFTIAPGGNSGLIAVSAGSPTVDLGAELTDNVDCASTLGYNWASDCTVAHVYNPYLAGNFIPVGAGPNVQTLADLIFYLSTITQTDTAVTGGNLTSAYNLTVQDQVTVSYDYTTTNNSGTPEPTTMALMGGALLGLGLLGKRFKKS